MKKYWHVLNIGIQNTLVYRVNFFLRSLFNLIPLLATIYLWRAVFESKRGGPTVAEYSFSGMVSYYLLITLVDVLTGVTEDDWQIAEEIREGQISQFILKPIDYLSYRLALFFSGRMVYTLMAAAPLLLFLGMWRHYFVGPASVEDFLLFLASTGLAALIQFFLSFTLASLAFWVLEVSTFIFIVYAFEYIAGGHLFPLDILPPLAAKALGLTPFPYELYFPVSVYLGHARGAALGRGFAMQLFWALAFYGLARWIWNRGAKKYTAFGG